MSNRMKIIDEKGRLFGKVNAFDVLVLAVAVVVAAGVFVKGHQVHSGSVETEQPITFQIRSRGMATYLADAIKVGDSISDADYASGDRPLGKIVDVTVESDPGHAMTSGLGDGGAEMVEVDDSVDLLITVEGSGVVQDREYAINRIYNIGTNSSRRYNTDRAMFYGVVADVR